MNLAQRLNELAQANSDGLLSDDEYRLLRQSAFEQHSGHVVVPADEPVVPGTFLQNTSTPKSPPAKSPTFSDNHHEPFTLTSFIHRASGKHDRNTTRDRPSTASSRTGGSASPPESPKPRRGLLPRIFQRKQPDLSLHIPSTTSTKYKTPHSSQSSTTMNSPSSRSKTRLSSPSSRKVVAAVPGPPLTPTKHADPTTSAGIREIVASTEAELERLVEAFDALEQGVVRRIKKLNARRISGLAPSILLDGREWREHRMHPSASTPVFDPRSSRLHYQSSLDQPIDKGSIHSSHSDRTSFSLSKSISSLPKQPPGSPLSPHFRSPPSLRRKGSMSSVSSRGASFSTVGRLAAPTTVPDFSQSSTHLPLYEVEEDQDHIAELTEIRQRKREAITRYTQRIEYLKAKQKGAELHEKLLRN